MDTELTVAICTRNRRASLVETLESVAPQEWDGAWEVLVVDNGSNDDTGSAVRALVADFGAPLRVEIEPKPGLAGARNRALQVARGRAVVFIDDDVTCDPGWLAGHGDAFREPDVVGVGGPIRPRMPPETPQWFLEILDEEIGGPTSRYDFGDEPQDIGEGGVPAPFGANMSMLRERSLSIGGFRTDLGWGKRMIPSEEYEFYRRYIPHGGRIVYRPAASLVHRIEAYRTTREYYQKWQRGYGRSVVVMDPPPTAAARWAAIKQQYRYMRAWAKKARRTRRRGDSEVAWIKALRQYEHHRGRFLELIRRRSRKGRPA